MKIIRSVICCFVLVISGKSIAEKWVVNSIASPSWTKWAKANSISKKGGWLVVRQPSSGFCYVSQGYEKNPGLMELSMKKDNIPLIILPYFRGVTGNISYRVDDKKIYNVKSGKNPIKLTTNIVKTMKSGRYLIVKIKPTHRPQVIQRFKLSGFKTASEYLGSSICRKKIKDKYYKF